MARLTTTLILTGLFLLAPRALRADDCACWVSEPPANEESLAGEGNTLLLPSKPLDAPVPWCMSADDSRCSPIHDGAGTTHSFATVLRAVPFGLPLVVPPRAENVSVKCVSSAPPSGVQQRVERPPKHRA